MSTYPQCFSRMQSQEVTFHAISSHPTSVVIFTRFDDFKRNAQNLPAAKIPQAYKGSCRTSYNNPQNRVEYTMIELIKRMGQELQDSNLLEKNVPSNKTLEEDKQKEDGWIEVKRKK
jgi:hypothetical protein